MSRVLIAVVGDEAEVSVQVPRAEKIMFYKIWCKKTCCFILKFEWWWNSLNQEKSFKCLVLLLVIHSLAEQEHWLTVRSGPLLLLKEWDRKYLFAGKEGLMKPFLYFRQFKWYNALLGPALGLWKII